MLNRHNRLLVTIYVLSDALLAVSAFVVAYALRFHTPLSRLIPITKGIPPLHQYVNVLPFIAALVPLGFQLQGLYRLRRGRSRVDDFFAVFVGSILAVVFGIVATLYVEIYFATNSVRADSNTLLDGVARHTEEGYAFQARSKYRRRSGAFSSC